MQLPKEIQTILQKLADAGFEGYAVGGCVRDLVLKKKPTDWDITTNAKPEELQSLFPESFYENTFGTVTVRTESDDNSLAEVQITPFRIESQYTDKRHPEEITFVSKLEDDLSRRDFTMNAMALAMGGTLVDLFGGQDDIQKKIIRTVGKPADRFGEDALRILRAARFSATLSFVIEPATRDAILANHAWLRAISKERIRDEFIKIIESSHAYEGIVVLKDLGLMEYIIPELLDGVDVEQNLHHIYTVWEHNLQSLKYTAQKKYSTVIRLAALLHDVGKPRAKRGEGRHCTFYGHDIVGARMAAQILERLRFSTETTERVTRLVRYHMFYYNAGEVTASSVRRLLANVGHENIDDLLKLREADRIGSGTPKAVPYKLRHLKYMIEKVSNDPVSVKMLRLNGNDIMELLNIAPSPKVGLLLNSLLAEVLDDPAKNTTEYLEQRARELNEQSPEDLRKSLERIQEARDKEEEEMMRKYYV